MAFVELALTPEIRRALHRFWGVAGFAERLFGGEESAAVRIGAHVVRVGPTWRSDAELRWAYSIAARVAADIPEVTGPVRHSGGGYVVRVGGRPVSVWPYVAGVWADPENHRWQAAQFLARLHRAFAAVQPERPRPSTPGPGVVREPLLQDPELDRWMDRFYASNSRQHPLHGDFYRGNVLVRSDVIVALLDWDDVLVGPPEQELAWAVWEWTQRGRTTLDLAAGQQFVEKYREAGGTARPITPEELAQLIRNRIRREVAYSQAVGAWGISSDPADLAYETRQLRAFRELCRD
jgi:Ser/Thr protein kinase RdoA (MazF antagonist)